MQIGLLPESRCNAWEHLQLRPRIGPTGGHLYGINLMARIPRPSRLKSALARVACILPHGRDDKPRGMVKACQANCESSTARPVHHGSAMSGKSGGTRTGTVEDGAEVASGLSG